MSVVDHLSRDERLERMYRRLGGRTRCCGICGEDDPRCLELHHVSGRSFSSDLVCLCRNCHRKLSDDQIDHPDQSSGIDKSILSKIRKRLGRADLFRALAIQDEEEALSIFERAQQPKELKP